MHYPVSLTALLLSVGLSACLADVQQTAGSDDEVLFLMQKPVEGERIVMEALYQGSVVERDGCLRLGDEPDSHTVVWPPGFSMESRGDARLVVDDKGRTIGQVGGFFRLGGGEVPTLSKQGPVEEPFRAVALSRCPGRYWIVGDVVFE